MPSLSGQPNISITVHTTATDFLSKTFETMMQKEEQSNIVLALALGAQKREQASRTAMVGRNLWVCTWTTRTSRATAAKPSLDLVFALYDDASGNYPLFIWTSHPSVELRPAFLEPRIQLAATQLRRHAPPERIFSVFGLAPVVCAFQTLWAHISGNRAEPVPFYSTQFTYCTKFTLQPANSHLPRGDSIRAAAIEDLEQVATMYREFTRESVFFPLSSKESVAKAQELIRENRVWLYETRDAHHRPCVASMIAATRCSANVAAVTKAFTAPSFRGRRFALRLVQYVTQQLLYNDGKDSVVVYVARESPAEKVFHRAGYAGLCGTPRNGMVEDWLEVGFKNTTRGHW